MRMSARMGLVSEDQFRVRVWGRIEVGVRVSAFDASPARLCISLLSRWSFSASSLCRSATTLSLTCSWRSVLVSVSCDAFQHSQLRHGKGVSKRMHRGLRALRARLQVLETRALVLMCV